MMKMTELAPPRRDKFGLVRRAVVVLFWSFSDAASQPTNQKTK